MKMVRVVCVGVEMVSVVGMWMCVVCVFMMVYGV